MFDLGFLSKLNDVRSEFERRERERNEREAYRFSPFRYLKDNEPGFTYMFADLLNPDGEHGQHAKFLKCFLDTVRISVPNTCVLNKASVRTKARTLHGRRPDIVIELECGPIVGFESKLKGANELSEQIGDYATELERRARARQSKDWYLIYLSNSASPPQSIEEKRRIQLERGGRLIHMKCNAGDDLSLSDWLDKCAESAPERLKWFIAEISRYVRNRYPKEDEHMTNNDVEKITAIADRILSCKPDERANACMLVGWADESRLSELRLRIIQGFACELMRRLQNDDAFTFTNKSMMDLNALRKPDPGLGLVWAKKGWPVGWGIAVELEKKRLIIGFAAPTADAKDREETNAIDPVCRAKIKETLWPFLNTIGTANDHQWWPVYTQPNGVLGSPYDKDWLAEIWKKVDEIANWLKSIRQEVSGIELGPWNKS